MIIIADNCEPLLWTKGTDDLVLSLQQPCEIGAIINPSFTDEETEVSEVKRLAKVTHS